MKSFLKIMAGVLLAVAVALVGLVRLTVEIIGASTTPGDFAELKQKFPGMLEWLAGTPWPVPTLLLILFSCLAAWLLISGTKGAVREEVTENVGLTRDEILALIQAHKGDERDWSASIDDKITAALAERATAPHPMQIFHQSENDLIKRAVIGAAALPVLEPILAEMRNQIPILDERWVAFDRFARVDFHSVMGETHTGALSRRARDLDEPFAAAMRIARECQIDFAESDLTPEEIPVPMHSGITDPVIYKMLREGAISFTKRRKAMGSLLAQLETAVRLCASAAAAPARSWQKLLDDAN